MPPRKYANAPKRTPVDPAVALFRKQVTNLMSTSIDGTIPADGIRVPTSIERSIGNGRFVHTVQLCEAGGHKWVTTIKGDMSNMPRMPAKSKRARNEREDNEREDNGEAEGDEDEDEDEDETPVGRAPPNRSAPRAPCKSAAGRRAAPAGAANDEEAEYTAPRTRASKRVKKSTKAGGGVDAKVETSDELAGLCGGLDGLGVESGRDTFSPMSALSRDSTPVPGPSGTYRTA